MLKNLVPVRLTKQKAVDSDSEDMSAVEEEVSSDPKKPEGMYDSC
jgi:hypothetical protein